MKEYKISFREPIRYWEVYFLLALEIAVVIILTFSIILVSGSQLLAVGTRH